MDVIIGVIISIVLCGLVILICACQKKEEKTSAEEKTPTEEKTSTTAQQMRNLAIKAQKAKAEREHQEDVDNGQKLLEKLPDFIHQRAVKGDRICVLTFGTDGYLNLLLSNTKNIKFNDIYYFLMIIEEYCEENGFEMSYYDKNGFMIKYRKENGFVVSGPTKPKLSKSEDVIISW